MDKNTNRQKNKYEDIIHLPHHVSKVHPQMARIDRAAQFSPFAALTGYEDAIKETGRRTDARMDLEEDAREMLDEKLRQIEERIKECPEAAITYFRPDDRKEGGAYITTAGVIKKIDRYEQLVIMKSGERISIREIIAIEEKA